MVHHFSHRDKTRRDLGGIETMDTLYPKSVKYSYEMRLPAI